MGPLSDLERTLFVASHGCPISSGDWPCHLSESRAAGIAARTDGRRAKGAVNGRGQRRSSLAHGMRNKRCAPRRTAVEELLCSTASVGVVRLATGRQSVGTSSVYPPLTADRRKRRQKRSSQPSDYRRRRFFVSSLSAAIFATCVSSPFYRMYLATRG